MLKNKRVIAIIPVRSGSKGVPGKNLIKLKGKTLLERTIEQSISCKKIDTTYVSTDSRKMFEISKKYKVNTKKLRPKSLSTDKASSIDVILHTLKEMNETNVIVILLQVTTPFRNKKDFNKIFKIFTKNKCNSVVSVSLLHTTHPDKVQYIKNGYVKSYLSKSPHIDRQSLKDVYFLNGAFYIADDIIIKKENTFITNKTKAYIMPSERSINIDRHEDLIMVRHFMPRYIK